MQTRSSENKFSGKPTLRTSTADEYSIFKRNWTLRFQRIVSLTNWANFAFAAGFYNINMLAKQKDLETATKKIEEYYNQNKNRHETY